LTLNLEQERETSSKFCDNCYLWRLIEAIKFRMEQLNYNQKDLAKVIGLKSRVSEILNKKRKLTIDMIRKLHESLSISTDVLLQKY